MKTMKIYMKAKPHGYNNISTKKIFKNSIGAN